MRERRGPFGRASELAEGVAAAMRRRQRDREPRVLIYDPAGISRPLRPDAPGYDRVLEICRLMVELVAAEVGAEDDEEVGGEPVEAPGGDPGYELERDPVDGRGEA